MTSSRKRNQALSRIWKEVINGFRRAGWSENMKNNLQSEDEPLFAEAGAALTRLLGQGVKEQELTALARVLVYEAIFETFTILEECELFDTSGLHEELLAAQPADTKRRKSAG